MYVSQSARFEPWYAKINSKMNVPYIKYVNREYSGFRDVIEYFRKHRYLWSQNDIFLTEKEDLRGHLDTFITEFENLVPVIEKFTFQKIFEQSVTKRLFLIQRAYHHSKLFSNLAKMPEFKDISTKYEIELNSK